QIWGQKRYAMRIWLDPVKLASYGVTVAEVYNSLNAQNVELPSGKIKGNNTELMVNTMGNLSTEEEFNNIIILAQGEKIVRLQDVGRASLEAENLETKLSQSGLPMIGMAIIPQPGTNYIEIADAFYSEFDKLKADLPSDLKIDIAMDN